MRCDLETLKDRVSSAYDPDEIVDMLNLTTADILEAFEEKLLEKLHLFDELDDPDESNE